MKIVVQLEPDATELALNDLQQEQFILDQSTYCYFRDKIFIKEMEKFIKEKAPGKWEDAGSLEGLAALERQLGGAPQKWQGTETEKNAAKVAAWYERQDLINEYYPKHNKRRQRFYLYNGVIYCYEFLGFMNVGNEIQLMKLDMSDIVNLLNQHQESPLSKLLRKLDIA